MAIMNNNEVGKPAPSAAPIIRPQLKRPTYQAYQIAQGLMKNNAQGLQKNEAQSIQQQGAQQINQANQAQTNWQNEVKNSAPQQAWGALGSAQSYLAGDNGGEKFATMMSLDPQAEAAKLPTLNWQGRQVIAPQVKPTGNAGINLLNQALKSTKARQQQASLMGQQNQSILDTQKQQAEMNSSAQKDAEQRIKNAQKSGMDFLNKQYSDALSQDSNEKIKANTAQLDQFKADREKFTAEKKKLAQDRLKNNEIVSKLSGKKNQTAADKGTIALARKNAAELALREAELDAKIGQTPQTTTPETSQPIKDLLARISAIRGY